MKEVLKRLKRRNKLAYFSLVALLFLYLIAIFADFIAPYPYDLQNREFSYCPPTRIHFREINGGFHLRPFVYKYHLKDPVSRKYEEDKSEVYFIRLFLRGTKHKLFGVIPSRDYLFGVGAPATLYLFGADLYGRDTFSRILQGARVSLSIGIIGVSISFFLGLLIGGISGYFGGKLDTFLMRMAELMMVFPGFYLMLALRATFPTTLSSVQVYLMIVIILSLIGWASLARVIRGMVLSLREEDYVLAAKAIGASNLRLIVRHILPNTLSYTITAATLSIPGYILGESALSLLGLGIQEPQSSWGNMLAAAIGNLQVISHFPWVLIPGLFIFISVMAFNFLGDGLRDVFDPKTW
ncbi:MAG: ABC transporter permease [bacterium (Candidatus Ratteibacteria) CG_4_10_14_3_um_filter_41_18]|uniref:ABC transporter permease n=3 Tax=Candidatus Ratteibacteria TaxID=2979319 RepID=A0A2M7E6W0_9BACT|nr:MAG: ABC transporter permease [Candidatus Omnitrophica bacterium CG1_02_41_171]PIV63431.1 MAG: ABC transporter permease [bacterium (Candidatus Ratteibacteria) CG01_land_8_20_14_3_00_40_19]PIX76609.1 MAG: ABC transporter permease [bacterium (Candidatus Ratteibacteria) CG_4_10_14_3_um_filter_41_18]PJA61783.1 MAG: ABC transporter permease [bacterium (Candidatus Ratteibacteria) CG_4_9_14_3_um_filter_41_21]HCG77145.1 ABC transporter permease [bacterium]